MVVVYIVFVILLPYCLFHCMLTVLPSCVLLPYRSYVRVSLFQGGVMVVLLGV